MDEIWARVDRFVDSCLDAPEEILIAHGIHLLAVERLRVAGKPIPPLLGEVERANTLRFLAGRSLLQRIRSSLDGSMVLLKGPEVAAHYPKPTLRAYGDLDILVRDSARAKAILLGAGFEEVEDFEFAHTQRPLRWPGLPLATELHHQLPWLRWVSAPSLDPMFDMQIPSATGIDGITTLPPTDHALLVAAHAWDHAPLRRLNDLIDVRAMIQGLDEDFLSARAEQIGMGNVWATTMKVSNDLLLGQASGSIPLRTWARHLAPPRERSVAEVHMARWIGAFWAPTPIGKFRSFAATLRRDFGPLPGEPWRGKLARTTRAVREADSPALLRPRESENFS